MEPPRIFLSAPFTRKEHLPRQLAGLHPLTTCKLIKPPPSPLPGVAVECGQRDGRKLQRWCLPRVKQQRECGQRKVWLPLRRWRAALPLTASLGHLFDNTASLCRAQFVVLNCPSFQLKLFIVFAVITIAKDLQPLRYERLDKGASSVSKGCPESETRPATKESEGEGERDGEANDLSSTIDTQVSERCSPEQKIAMAFRSLSGAREGNTAERCRGRIGPQGRVTFQDWKLWIDNFACVFKRGIKFNRILIFHWLQCAWPLAVVPRGRWRQSGWCLVSGGSGWLNRMKRK